MNRFAKALTGAVLVSMLAAPAWAATQWSFSGSLMYKTFWTERDYGKFKGEDLQGGGAELKSDGVLDWSTQGDSTISMEMRSDHLEGYIEMNYDFEENSLTTSQYWGKYNFSHEGAILIGQTEHLFRQFISNQVAFDNINLNGIGTAYAETSPMIALQYGGFTFALVKPNNNLDGMFDNAMGRIEGQVDMSGWVPPPGTFIDGGMYYDMDTYMPQIQASYEYTADAWRIKLAGGYANFKVKKLTEWSQYNNGGVIDEYFEYAENKTVHSWIIGLDGDINFGPLTLGAAASVGQNWGMAGWNETDFSIGSYTLLNMAGKFKDTTSVMASIVAAYRLTEALGFEAGLGYRYDNNPVFDKASHSWGVYLQADYAVADGFYIMPEIGFIDCGDFVGNDKWVNATEDYRVKGGTSEGYLWYAGVQWKMDF